MPAHTRSTITFPRRGAPVVPLTSGAALTSGRLWQASIVMPQHNGQAVQPSVQFRAATAMPGGGSIPEGAAAYEVCAEQGKDYYLLLNDGAGVCLAYPLRHAEPPAATDTTPPPPAGPSGQGGTE